MVAKSCLKHAFRLLRPTMGKEIRCFSSSVTCGKQIDLRSDTVTKPCADMLKVMFSAQVADDVYKEDETVNTLEKITAELFGMERSLFVPSGTMGNLICIMAHCQGRGEELIIGSDQHVYKNEQGHFMQYASVPARVIPNETNGEMDLSVMQKNIYTNEDFHNGETKLICLENTHMDCGGIPLSNEYLDKVGELSQKHKISVHVDGARLFNAAVATNQPLGDLLINAHSVSMCLSKGLGCPVGSVIGGSEEFIWKATRIRKSLGGGMRQIGFLAAAGLFALEHGHIYVQKDHDNAKLLSECINSKESHDLITVNEQKVWTNIVFVECKRRNAFDIVQKLKERSVLALAFSDSLIRMVTHRDVHEKDIFAVNDILDDIIRGFS